MRLRVVAGTLALLSAVLYAAVVVPTRREAATRDQEYRRLRDTGRDSRAQLRKLEQRSQARERARAVLAEAASRSATGPDALTALRREVLEALEGLPLGKQRLAVQPETAPAVASFTLSATGPYRTVIGLAGDLARPRDGLILDSVVFRPDERGASVTIRGVRPGGPQ